MALRWDRQLERWQVAHRSGFLDPVFKAITYAGVDGAVWIVIALVLAVAWRRPEVFVWTLAADAVAWGLSTLLHAVIPRARPSVHTLIPRPHSHSFPSGHATTSFACATALALLVPRFRIAFFVLAAAIAWSRVYVGVHYPLDVLAGAVLGAAIGYGVVRTAVAFQARTVGSADGRAGKAGTS